MVTHHVVMVIVMVIVMIIMMVIVLRWCLVTPGPASRTITTVCSSAAAMMTNKVHEPGTGINAIRIHALMTSRVARSEIFHRHTHPLERIVQHDVKFHAAGFSLIGIIGHIVWRVL
jgi:hypothetical protein